MTGNADVRIRKSQAKLNMSGKETAAVGTLGGESTEILIKDAIVTINTTEYRCTKVDIKNGRKYIFMDKNNPIYLVRPTIELKEQALEYRNEHFLSGENIINGSELLDQTENYEEWLAAVTANTNKESVNENWVVTDTFFAIRKSDNKIIGIIDLRHTLNDFLKDFGNCGYSVRPSERGKGYATEMLRQIIGIAKKAGLSELHLSVERSNKASINVIQSNGGVYERSFTYESELADIYRIEI